MNNARYGAGSMVLKLLIRAISSRYLIYGAFLFIMICKLLLIHYKLHIANIDMSGLDIVIALGSLLLASFWTLWLPRRGLSVSLIILDVLLTSLIYSDLIYYRYFQDFITIPVLTQAGQVSSLGDSIRSLLIWTDNLFFIDWIFLLAIAIGIVIYRFTSKPRQLSYVHSTKLVPRGKRMLRRFAAGMVAFILGLVFTYAPIKHYVSTWAQGLFTGNWWNMSLYNVTGLLGFHGYDIYRYGKDHLGPQPKLPQNEVESIRQWFSQKQAARSTQDEMFGKYKGSNVIVIQAEAFMNFMINQKIGDQEITPNFNKLMKESMYFSQYYHQTGQGRTSDADFSSHASLHPLPSGSVFIRYPDHKYDVLPAILKEHGYDTSAFHAYNGSFWNRYNMYRAMGYDTFFSKKDFTMDEPLGWSLGDKSFFRQSLEHMQEIKQPFYSFMITLTTHHPYTLPKNMQELDVKPFSGTIFGDYLQSIHYLDAALGELVMQMKQQGLWDNTILYIYGDHDDSIKEKAYYEKFLGKKLTEMDMENIMNQVPLLVHLPDGGSAGIYDEPAGQLDMAPSLMHLLGISTKPYHMMGNDLFDGKKRFVVLRSGAFSDGKLMFIPAQTSLFKDGSCYDLGSGTLTDVNACRPGYDKGRKELSVSDKVMEYDLLRQFESKKP